MRSWRTLLALAFFLFLFFSHSPTSAQVSPKREFRGAWIATVVNLDWPTTRGADPNTQRTQLISILDGLKGVGINAVVFQVRPECDALYSSLIEPWSYWLTGQQGKAPVSTFDPLDFATIEAHKRGMEIHAWFNPYRAERVAGNYPLASNHVAVQHPDWILSFGSLRMLDPGMPAVRDHVVKVIMDVVRRYDVDGIHWDDYFYPYSGIANEDSASWRLYNREFTDKASWRRDNVNLLVRTVHDSIQAVKSNVKFGISPFGIWKNGTPSGIVGTSAYDALYCDAVTWLNQQWIDYITPQLYWTFGYGQDYARLAPWWASMRNGKHLYPGLASYRILKDAAPNDVYPKSDWPASDVLNQVRLNRAVGSGSVFFRAKLGLLDNPKGLADSLKNNLYKYPALRPIMAWKETIPPNPPSSLAIARFSSFATISWSAPSPAQDGGVAEEYVLYRSASLPIQFDDARNILAVQSSPNYIEQSLPGAGLTYYYGVTGLDRLHNESGPSNITGLTSTGVVGVEQEVSIAKTLLLHQNYPNPFNPTTIIAFHLPIEQKVTLRVYDLLGREIRVLADGMLSAGDHYSQFDGSGLASGVYVYRIIAGNHVESRKMQLVK
ncbi:MAG: family 10 glycosylhydrolase [Ignavibacteria bacterium]|nr:family 10 glycosylhydrolase [Ignavibacteria bacterium]